jgi:hypothetical protein
VPDGTDPKENASDMVTELEPDDGGVEHPDVEFMTDRTATCMEEVTKVAAHDRVKLLAAIPKPRHRLIGVNGELRMLTKLTSQRK